MLELRLPNITANTDKGQLEQIRGYLYQMVQQLNWALSNIDTKADEVTKKVEASTQQKNAVEQAQATFSEVKSLIIKSADIVNAYYEEINHRLEGIYVAESDFGKYKQETSASFEANSERVNILFENQQTMQTNMDGLGADIGAVEDNVGRIDDVLVRNQHDTTIVGSQAWCKIGKLEDGEFPIYGIEIGQENSHGDQKAMKFAQYRSDGVRLFDQYGNEVVVISNYNINITSAEIRKIVVTDTLEFDGYSVITKNGLGFKWRGRDKA